METVSRLERGRQLPRLDHLDEVATALGTTVGTLVDDDDPVVVQPDLPPDVNRVVHALRGRDEATQRRLRQAAELTLAMADAGKS